MSEKRAIGFLFILVGAALLSRNLIITGAIIGRAYSNSVNILSIVFFIVGVMLLISERERIESRIAQFVALEVPKTKIDSIQLGIQTYDKRMPKGTRKEVYEEIANIIEQVQSGSRVGGTYNLHVLHTIPPGLTGIPASTRILEGNAKVLSSYTHQERRGTERYIFDKSTGEMLGIAYHPRGNPRDLKWRVKF